MIHECIKCKEDFLTEADAFIVYPKPSGTELQCLNCFEEQITTLKEREAKLIDLIKEFIDTFDLFDEVPLPFKIVNKMDSVVKKSREVLKELGVKGDQVQI